MGRRRLMMGQKASIPSGYITNGLVFFLDGKQLANATSWTDIVGGKTFSLTNCSVGTNGIVFDGTAYGEYNGRITTAWSSETIEIVVNGNTNWNSRALFVQPYMDDSVGISLRMGNGGGTVVRYAIGCDGVSRAQKTSTNSATRRRISINQTNGLVINEAAQSGTSATSYAKNQCGITFLSGWKATPSGNYGGFYTGTIYAVRIYNRALSVDEMKANQAVDNTYYFS